MKEVEILHKLAVTARQEPVPRINAIPGVFRCSANLRRR